ncbi:hypothetical protein MMC10_003917 [Thelotrema lepadinum]|nr:hypothetical protein [Thelotrema lepadinum]
MRLQNTTSFLPLLLSLVLSLALTTSAYYPDPGLNHRRSYRRSTDGIFSNTFPARSADALGYGRSEATPNWPQLARRGPSSIHMRRATPDVNQGMPPGADTKGLPDGTYRKPDGTYGQTQALKDFFKKADAQGDANTQKYLANEAKKTPQQKQQECEQAQQKNRQNGIPSLPGGSCCSGAMCG